MLLAHPLERAYTKQKNTLLVTQQGVLFMQYTGVNTSITALLFVF
jgi:hypothetical protein